MIIVAAFIIVSVNPCLRRLSGKHAVQKPLPTRPLTGATAAPANRDTTQPAEDPVAVPVARLNDVIVAPHGRPPPPGRLDPFWTMCLDDLAHLLAQSKPRRR